MLIKQVWELREGELAQHPMLKFGVSCCMCFCGQINRLNRGELNTTLCCCQKLAGVSRYREVPFINGSEEMDSLHPGWCCSYSGEVALSDTGIEVSSLLAVVFE